MHTNVRKRRGQNLGALLEIFSDNESASELIRSEGGKITATYTVDSKGILKKIAMVFDATMKMEIPMEGGAAISMDVAYAYDMTMTVKATGKDVNVTFPDFSGYQEIDPSQMTGIAA